MVHSSSPYLKSFQSRAEAKGLYPFLPFSDFVVSSSVSLLNRSLIIKCVIVKWRFFKELFWEVVTLFLQHGLKTQNNSANRLELKKISLMLLLSLDFLEGFWSTCRSFLSPCQVHVLNLVYTSSSSIAGPAKWEGFRILTLNLKTLPLSHLVLALHPSPMCKCGSLLFAVCFSLLDKKGASSKSKLFIISLLIPVRRRVLLLNVHAVAAD